MSIVLSASGSVLIASGASNSNYSGSVIYGPKQVYNGLVLYVDAANPLSYPGSGDTWYDLINNNNGYLSGSINVTPSWEGNNQGRIYVKATSSYISGSGNINTPMSSSFINFGNILNEVFVGGTSSYSLPSSVGGGTTFVGDNAKFTLNLWFELDYNKQIVQSVASEISPLTDRIWRVEATSNRYQGNVPSLISKYGDNNIIEQSGYQTGNNLSNNAQFRLILFDVSQNGASPPPTSYRYAFQFRENPSSTSRAIQLINTSSVFRIPANTPTNICITFDSSKPISSGDVSNTDGRVKMYINGYRTNTGDLMSITGTLLNSYTGSNSQLALGAEIGATPRLLEGSINGPLNNNARGTSAQIDAKYYIFQVYNRALTPQEVEQNFWAHKYRFPTLRFS